MITVHLLKLVFLFSHGLDARHLLLELILIDHKVKANLANAVSCHIYHLPLSKNQTSARNGTTCPGLTPPQNPFYNHALYIGHKYRLTELTVHNISAYGTHSMGTAPAFLSFQSLPPPNRTWPQTSFQGFPSPYQRSFRPSLLHLGCANHHKSGADLP